MIIAMTDIELEVASQTLIDFMREHDEIYGKFSAGELGAVLGNVMFVFGSSYDAWLHASENDIKETDSVEDIINKGKGIYTDNN